MVGENEGCGWTRSWIGIRRHVYRQQVGYTFYKQNFQGLLTVPEGGKSDENRRH